MKKNYSEFLSTKRLVAEPSGCQAVSINRALFDFQADITAWALRLGRAAIFAGTGLGKTLMQLEWAREVGGRVLIVAPLCVNSQTVEMGRDLLDIEVREVEAACEIQPGINITNYEKLHHFEGVPLDGIVLEESSILKSIDGKTRKLLLDKFTRAPFRLCCTATPAPNDIAELANHAEFLGHMKRVEMLAAFFVHDDEGWRLRGHALKPFCRWLASWSMWLTNPADLGYDGSRFVLPPLNIEDSIVQTTWRKPGELFAGKLKGITDRAAVRKQTVAPRVGRVAEILARDSEQWLVWCGLNDEQDALARALGDDCVSIDGQTPVKQKIEREGRWRAGNVRVLVTKPSVFGFGMNWQHCHNMAFLGMNDSFEGYFQAIRREWRFGQVHPVRVVIVVTDHENEIVLNVRRKEQQSFELTRHVIQAAIEFEREQLNQTKVVENMERANYQGQDWDLVQGDCIEAMQDMADDSVDLSVYSPPFSSLYTYSASEHDLGNCAGIDKFMEHYRFVVEGVLRITKPGRLTAVHCQQLSTTLASDGVIGLRDFRGRLVQEYIAAGWIYHGEICIDKDPQAQAIRTHSKALLFVQLRKDSSWLRPAMADYVLLFRKPGENAVPIHPDLTNDEWIEWARPIWYGIRESDTLNVAEARSADDDRHICPLQLGTIERCVRLWSNPGELVFSPFAGIGSEGYVALQQGRRFRGIELKGLYAKTAVKNLKQAIRTKAQAGLFDLASAAK